MLPTTPQLSFSNYSDPTTNGSSLSSVGVGANLQLGTPVTADSTGGSTMPSATVASPTTPAVGGTGQNNGFFGENFWSKDGGAGMILGGVQVLGNLWNSYQSHKLAKEQMGFAREQWDTNLANQTQTYNTALEDRIRGRYAQGTRTEAQLQGEIDKHSL